MTNRNSAQNDEHGNEPFLMKPAAKNYLWGGNRLNEDFGKNIDLSPLAETWECSTHPDGPSIVASGELSGLNLRQVLAEHPEYLGTRHEEKGELPILIKLIDAKQNLSVQVHPDDAYAAANEGGQLGKTEMWYVLEADEDAKLVYGLTRDLDKDTMTRSIADGTVERYLNKIPVRKDDLFFIEAGTIHALGAGVLVAEIQESSNLTYRLYDYDRRDKDGNKRELHVAKAMDVANLKESQAPRQPMHTMHYRRGYAAELVCRCRYFEVYRLLINTGPDSDNISYSAGKTSFSVLLCIDGGGKLSWSGGSLTYKKGDCIFVPADSVNMEISGKAKFLDVKG